MRGIAALVMLLSSGAALADPVDNAFRLCATLDATGLTSAPCEVGGWSSTVTAVIDMNSAEARDLCAKIAAHVQGQGMDFEGNWSLHIRSPYSGDNDIAFCQLR